MRRRISRRALVTVATTVGSILLVLLAWQIAVSASGLSTYLAKGPLDVLRYLFVDGDGESPASAGARRSALLGLLLVTVRHAVVGLAIGVGIGTLTAVILGSFSTLRAMFLPLAIFLQTVPLIALAPVIYAVFGGGVATSAVICGVVTFFPLLVNVITGLRSGGGDIEDVVAVFGGGRFTVLRLVAIPTALPYLFTGLKIAAPATVSGAMLYEYLFTFQGLGAALVTSKSYSDYALLWTIVVVSLLLSLAFYAAVVLIETAVLAKRYPPRHGLARVPRPVTTRRPA